MAVRLFLGERASGINRTRDSFSERPGCRQRHESRLRLSAVALLQRLLHRAKLIPVHERILRPIAPHEHGRVFAPGQNQALVRWIQIGKTEEDALERIRAYDLDIWKNFYAAMGRLIIAGGVAYGLFLDNTSRTFFDMGKTDPSRVTFGAASGELNYYVFTGGKERCPSSA